MKVLFLQRQPCIRALKYASALQSSGADIQLAFAYQGRTLDQFYGSGDDLFTEWCDLGEDARPADELSDALDAFQPDLIHSHNLPDSLTVLALELVSSAVPVIHDVHDLQSLRATPYRDGFPEPSDPLALERAAVEGASALITVSAELLDVLDDAYALPKRTLVVPNAALRSAAPALPPERHQSQRLKLVYEGTLSTDGGHYDLRDIFTTLAHGEIELHVHPSRPAPAYEALFAGNTRVVVHEPVEPDRLLELLPTYDLGWAGFNDTVNGAHLDTVLPNKLFDYLVCGLPVATLSRHRALRRFVSEEGVGVVLDDAADLAALAPRLDIARWHRAIALGRERYTFDHAVSSLSALYVDLEARRPPVGAEHAGV